MNVTVVGIGSPFGMDRLGWQVIDYLKRQHQMTSSVKANVNLVCCDRPGMALLDFIKDADLAILVDAVLGGAAGTIHQLEVGQWDQLKQSDSPFSSHDVGVAETLTLGDKLNMLPERIVLYGIEVGGVPQDDNNMYGDSNNNTCNTYHDVDKAVRLVSDRIMITISKSLTVVQ
ncbi:MAG: hydrogenase maturation protease [Gammaproteobacteria bacterium]|jgi:hydrogenase maturation protease